MTAQQNGIKGCPEGKTQWTRSCPCTHPDLIPCKQQYRRPNEAPLCWGTYKDLQKCCKECRVVKGCAEELALSIIEGRHGKIIQIGDLS